MAGAAPALVHREGVAPRPEIGRGETDWVFPKAAASNRQHLGSADLRSLLRFGILFRIDFLCGLQDGPQKLIC